MADKRENVLDFGGPLLSLTELLSVLVEQVDGGKVLVEQVVVVEVEVLE